MIAEIANNPILEIVERLALLTLAFIPLMVAVVQGLKQLTGLDGTWARLMAIAVNLAFGLSIAVVFLYPGTAVYVGVGIFLLVLAVAPLGGYDLLKRYAGDRTASPGPGSDP